jgi:hypothetical protein
MTDLNAFNQGDMVDPGASLDMGASSDSDFTTAVLSALLDQGVDILRLSQDQLDAIVQAAANDSFVSDVYDLENDPTALGNIDLTVTPTQVRDAIRRQLFSPSSSTNASALQQGLHLLEQTNAPLDKSQRDYLATGSSASGSSGNLADLARRAGFPEDQIATAVAVAMAESGGNPEAVGDQSIGGSIGLWQIYTVAHPDLAARFNLRDPFQNAQAAFIVWQNAGGSWTPWATYNTEAYRQYLGSQGPYVQAGKQPGTDLSTVYPGAASAFRSVYGRDPSNQELLQIVNSVGSSPEAVASYLRGQPSHVPGLSNGGLSDLRSQADAVSQKLFGHGVTDGMLQDLNAQGMTTPALMQEFLTHLDVEGKMPKDAYSAIYGANQPYLGGIYGQGMNFDPRIALSQYQQMQQQGHTPETIVQHLGPNAPGFNTADPANKYVAGQSDIGFQP